MQLHILDRVCSCGEFRVLSPQFSDQPVLDTWDHGHWLLGLYCQGVLVVTRYDPGTVEKGCRMINIVGHVAKACRCVHMYILVQLKCTGWLLHLHIHLHLHTSWCNRANVYIIHVNHSLSFSSAASYPGNTVVTKAFT